MRKQFVLLVLASLLGAPVLAKELAGVTMPDTLNTGGKSLKLNGIGLRKKAIFKVYVAGLYLETPSQDVAAIIGSDQVKVVRMHFLRDLSRQQLVDAYQESFAANAKDKLSAQKANIDKFLALLTDVKEGEELVFSYVPGKGTSVLKGDKQIGSIEGKDFGAVLFSVWLGPAPPTEDLKKGMLGK